MSKLQSRFIPIEFQRKLNIYQFIDFDIVWQIKIKFWFGQNADWYRREQQRKLFISWRNAVACTVFYDVIDILSIRTILGVFVEEKHVSVKCKSNVRSLNIQDSIRFDFRHTVFRIHYIMAVLVFLKSLSLMFHSINFHFIEVKGEHIEAWAILYYVTHL